MDEEISKHIINNASQLINDLLDGRQPYNHCVIEGIEETFLSAFTNKSIVNCRYHENSEQLKLFIKGVDLATNYLVNRDLLKGELKVLVS